MARLRALKGIVVGIGPVLGMTAVLLVSLQLMSDATRDSSSFNRIYSVLLVVNVIGIAGLALLISVNLMRLLNQLRRGVAGARLTARMLMMFVVLSVVPVIVVYYFSLQFLHRGIDDWFDVQIEKALDDSLALSQTALDTRMRELLAQTRNAAEQLTQQSTDSLPVVLGDLRDSTAAAEILIMNANGAVLASSNTDASGLVPDIPDDAVLLQVAQTGSYVGLDPLPQERMQIRTLVSLSPSVDTGQADQFLQAFFPVPERMNELSASVQAAYAYYQELTYLRKPLKMSFTLTLSLVCLLSMLSAVWAAFYSARRLAAPIRDLAEGTRAVSAGNYETQLEKTGSDDIAILVESFNDMTRNIRIARDAAAESQRAVEEQRTYLEAVLSRLSTGVITFGPELELHTVNAAACQILNADLSACLQQPVAAIASHHPHLASLCDLFREELASRDGDWRKEIPISGDKRRQVLLCQGTRIGTAGDYIVVFDDVTTLIKAQKEAAWSEVARRLAHEIKNPLTPIQLSAERLRHKYLQVLPDDQTELMDRLTSTIVQQVDALKAMINAFSDYARAPKMQPRDVDPEPLLKDVIELYRYNKAEVVLNVDLQTAGYRLHADPDQLRQVLHNLLKNAVEAPGATQLRVITLRAAVETDAETPQLVIDIADNGDGFDNEILASVFEPYVTNKTKGSGLGLAIVRRIIEDHGGSVLAENAADQGAQIKIHLPAFAHAAGQGVEQHAGGQL